MITDRNLLFNLIRSDLVSKAAPDGYTLLMGGPGWSSTLPAVEGRSKGPDDLEAVCLINYNSILVVAHPDAPFKTFKQMMTWTKANPGKLLVGNAGPWLQVDIFWKQLMKQTGITVKIVPYDGGGPQMMAVLGSHVQVGGASPSQYVPYMNTGKLIPLLFLDNKRHPSFPDVPTSIEEGVNIVSRLWRGILAPKNTPRPVIEKLATAFKKMTEDKSVISMIEKYGDDINYLGPEEFTKYWRTEYENYKELGKIFKK
jgi:tripartite-type tricarboxylate transporter receptor subunit TctC